MCIHCHHSCVLHAHKTCTNPTHPTHTFYTSCTRAFQPQLFMLIGSEGSSAIWRLLAGLSGLSKSIRILMPLLFCRGLNLTVCYNGKLIEWIEWKVQLKSPQYKMCFQRGDAESSSSFENLTACSLQTIPKKTVTFAIQASESWLINCFRELSYCQSFIKTLWMEICKAERKKPSRTWKLKIVLYVHFTVLTGWVL